MNRKKEAVLLNIKFHREKRNGADDGESQKGNTKYPLLSTDVAADPQGVL